MASSEIGPDARGCANVAVAMMTSSSSRMGTWVTHQFDFVAEADVSNPYVDISFWVDFVHEDGSTLRRPGFWAGGRSFAVRFAAAGQAGQWSWRTESTPQLQGLS